MPKTFYEGLDEFLGSAYDGPMDDYEYYEPSENDYINWNEANDYTNELDDYETVACIVCGQQMEANEWDEPCNDCMNPPMPREVGEYRDSHGNDYGWQDSTFPNEY